MDNIITGATEDIFSAKCSESLMLADWQGYVHTMIRKLHKIIDNFKSYLIMRS